MKKLQERIAFVKEVTGWSNAELARQAGVSRTAPTDWLNGGVSVLSSKVAQNLSARTPFTVNWLATGDKPMYKGEVDLEANTNWPFKAIDEQKIRTLADEEKKRLEAAFIAAAGFIGIDIKSHD